MFVALKSRLDIVQVCSFYRRPSAAKEPGIT